MTSYRHIPTPPTTLLFTLFVCCIAALQVYVRGGAAFVVDHNLSERSFEAGAQTGVDGADQLAERGLPALPRPVAVSVHVRAAGRGHGHS